MLGLNTITLISSRVGSFIKRIVTDGLKMRLPFTSAEHLGGELVTNGDFATNSDWNLGQGQWSISNGFAVADNANNNLHTSLPVASAVGLQYKITFTLQDVTQGHVKVGLSDINSTQFNSDDTYTLYIESTGNRYLYFDPSGFTGKLTNVSVKLATQETPDISGNDNNAILKTGKCLHFDGSNDDINIDGFNVDTDEATFAFWAKPDGNADTSSDMIIDLGTSSRFFIGVNQNLWRVVQYETASEYGLLNDPNWKVTPNHWQRVVVSIDKDNYVSVYSNGVLLSDPRLLTKPLNLSGKTRGSIAAKDTSNSNHYGGYLSDLQVYDKAWSSDDVTYDYANPQNLVTDNLSSDIHLRNLKAWWHLSEGSGSVIHDSAPLIGGELTTNGDFSINGQIVSDSYTLGWRTSDTDPSNISNGVLNLVNNDDGEGFDGRVWATNGVDSGYLYLNQSSVYKVTYTIYENENNANINFFLGSSGFTGNQPNNVGTHVIYLEPDSNAYFLIRNASNNTTIKFSNISVKEVYNINGTSYDNDTNNDGTILGADWEDSQERIPQLGMMNWSKGSNLIEYSEDFTEWTLGSNATLTYESDVVAPDGTIGVYRLLLPAQGSTFLQSPTYAAGSGRVFSMWVKKTDSSNTDFNFYDGTTASSTLTATNDWQRFEVNSFTGNQATIVNDGDTFISDIYIWGAQVESGTTASAYRKTNGLSVTNSTLIKTPDVEQFTGNKVTRNLIRYSEHFDNSLSNPIYWTHNEVSVEGGYEDPNGNNNAWKITSAGSSDYLFARNYYNDGINAQGKTKSIWARTVSGTGTTTLCNYHGYNSSQFNLTEQWQRFEVDGNANGNEHFYAVDFRGSTTLTEVLIYGPQLQEGGLTRYFPTYGNFAEETLPIIGKDILGNDVETRNVSLNLDGTGYAELLDDNDFDIPGSSTQNGGAFSICGWAKWKYVQQAGGSSLNTIYCNGIAATAQNDFSVNSRLYNGNNVVSAWISGTEINGSTTYTQGEWFYFALTREVTTGSCKLYTSRVDGSGQWVVALDGTATNTNSLINNGNKIIGWDESGNDRKYYDLIDDIKFYERELSLTEIQQNFNATKSAHTN